MVGGLSALQARPRNNRAPGKLESCISTSKKEKPLCQSSETPVTPSRPIMSGVRCEMKPPEHRQTSTQSILGAAFISMLTFWNCMFRLLST